MIMMHWIVATEDSANICTYIHFSQVFVHFNTIQQNINNCYEWQLMLLLLLLLCYLAETTETRLLARQCASPQYYVTRLRYHTDYWLRVGCAPTTAGQYVVVLDSCTHVCTVSSNCTHGDKEVPDLRYLCCSRQNRFWGTGKLSKEITKIG